MFLRKLLCTAVLALTVVTVSNQAKADEHGNFMIRVLGTGVLPDAGADVTTPAGVPVPTIDADVSDQFIPATTLTYFLNQNFALELFCCFAKHQAEGARNLTGVDIADFWIFPPVVTLQYHFTNMGSFKPYVGAGVQYIHFFDEDAADLSANTKVDIDDAFGFALQAGVDVSLGGGWYLNADVKKVWLDTDVKWRATAAGGANLDADLDVDPLIVSAGVGYRFNLSDLFGRRSAAPLK